MGAFGRSGIYTLMSMFTLVFFQNGAGLSLSQGTTIILIGRIFDALNDPVMGMIVDRTKSKWGKMRPYLLFAPVPIAICTILLFTAPFKEGSTAAFVWALITYILWGVAFTVQDVPFWGLSSVITPLESERTSFISTARLGSTFGGILPALLVPILYQSNMGYNKGFFVGALIFALLGCGLSILIFFVSKERVPKMDHTPLLQGDFCGAGQEQAAADRYCRFRSGLHYGYRQPMRGLYRQLHYYSELYRLPPDLYGLPARRTKHPGTQCGRCGSLRLLDPSRHHCDHP